MDELTALWVRVTGPDGQRVTVPIPAATIVAGRGTECTVRLDHALVSRRHARFDCGPDGFWRVTDLRSRNGTRVDGTTVDPAGPGVAVDGRRIEIGPFTLRIGPPAHPDPSYAHSGRPMQTADDSPIIWTLGEFASPKISVEQLGCLEHFSRSLLSIASVEGRLTALCRLMLSPSMGGRWAVVIAAETDGEHHAICPLQQAAGAKKMPEPRLSRSLMSTARHRREPVLATSGGNVDVDNPVALALSVAVDGDAAAAIAVPLSDEQGSSKPSPLLYAAFPHEYGTGEWLALCALAARHHLHAETVWANLTAAGRLARLEADLERARRVQDRLIPVKCELPGFEVAVRFRPCHGVGGDYVDAMALPDGTSLFVIADVVGKGLAAAMVAMGVHTIVHAEARRWTTITDLAAALDAHLVESLGPGSFVTLIAMTIDPSDGRIRVVNAGHPPVVVFSPAAGGFCREIAVRGGHMLGPFPQILVPFNDKLDEGESLLLITDGFSEVFNTGGEMLDVEGLCRLVGAAVATSATAATAADAVVEMTDKWQKTGEPRDDRTLMLIRRR